MTCCDNFRGLWDKRLKVEQLKTTACVRPCLREVSARRGEAEAAVEEAKLECAQLRSAAREEAREEATRVKEVANAEAEGIKREARAERAALEAEKAAMEKVHAFQKNKITLNVGGHRFETSL